MPLGRRRVAGSLLSFTLRGEAIRPLTAYEVPIRMQQVYLRGEGV